MGHWQVCICGKPSALMFYQSPGMPTQVCKSGRRAPALAQAEVPLTFPTSTGAFSASRAERLRVGLSHMASGPHDRGRTPILAADSSAEPLSESAGAAPTSISTLKRLLQEFVPPLSSNFWATLAVPVLTLFLKPRACLLAGPAQT